MFAEHPRHSARDRRSSQPDWDSLRPLARVRLAGAWWRREPEREIVRVRQRDGVTMDLCREVGDEQWWVVNVLD